jgi:activating signal cointegrator complex subunit 3
MVNSTIAKLVKSGCVLYNSEEETVTSTTLGRLASFYYLSHETIEYMNNALVPNLPIASLIQILANAKEFFGLPVRHNEDVLNEGLTHLVPIKVPKHDLENPHVKANLLIQAHLERCHLPITDYYTDTKSVLDQSIRVLQGMIDVAAYKGNLQTTLNLIHLMQMMIQGQWLDQSVLRNVPHFTDEIVRKLGKMGVYYLPDLILRTQGNIKKFLRSTLKESFTVRFIKNKVYRVMK